MLLRAFTLTVYGIFYLVYIVSTTTGYRVNIVKKCWNDDIWNMFKLSLVYLSNYYILKFDKAQQLKYHRIQFVLTNIFVTCYRRKLPIIFLINTLLSLRERNQVVWWPCTTATPWSCSTLSDSRKKREDMR